MSDRINVSLPVSPSVDDLVNCLSIAVARVRLANGEGSPILSAWLPDAEAILGLNGQRNVAELMWTKAHAEAATAEGWNIWTCEGGEDGRWQVQRIDDPEAFADVRKNVPPLLASDEEAFRIVATGIGPHHLAARVYMETFNPEEYASIMSSSAEDCPVVDGSSDSQTKRPTWDPKGRERARSQSRVTSTNNTGDGRGLSLRIEVEDAVSSLYAVTGRIPGDDDDTLELIVAEDQWKANQVFRERMKGNLACDDADRLRTIHGSECFIVTTTYIGDYSSSSSLRLAKEFELSTPA